MRSIKSKHCRDCCPSAPGANEYVMIRDTGIRLKLTSINTRVLILPTGFVHSAWRRRMPNGSRNDQQLKLRPRRPDLRRASARRAAGTCRSRWGLAKSVSLRAGCGKVGAEITGLNYEQSPAAQGRLRTGCHDP